ncbi:MAG: hypothetical protein ACKPA9_04465, partial [Microcystis sp.]
MSIVFDLERTNQLNPLPDKDLVDLCPPIEPYQVTKNHNSLILQIISSVIIALLAGATAPWWWQEIKSFFARKPPEPTPIPTPTYTPQKTLINIAYAGDNFGCVLPIAINISGQYFYPQGNFSTINNIDLGQQR